MMKPQHTVFVDHTKDGPIVFVWNDDISAFVHDDSWEVLSEGSFQPHEQPFTLEMWNQPVQVHGLDGMYYLVDVKK